MDRKLKMAMIVMWSVIAILLSSLLVYGITNGGGTHNIFRIGRIDIGPSKIQKQQSVSLDNCNKINVDFSSSDIVVKTTDDNELKVIQRGNGDLKENQKFTVSSEDNTVTIKQGNSHIGFFILGFGSIGSQVEIDIPKTYSKDLDITATSGDIDFDSDINLNSIKCTQNSGDFNCSSILTADEIYLDATSGDIYAKNIDSKKYDISTSSGDIEIKSLSGSGQIEATSGSVTADYSDIRDYSDISVTSGDIDLTVPGSLSFEFSGKCTSGDIDSDFDMNYNKKGNEASAKIGNGPYKKLNASTTSGDIKISKK